MIKGVWVNGEFNELKAVLDNWVEMVEQYSDTIEGDACYWFNERATVSVLAAAAWKTAGWIALEEFSTTKACDESEDGAYGRCDLYLSGVNFTYACEAKQAWHKVDEPNDFEAISVKLKGALNDASKLLPDEADKMLALCFCIPSFESTPSENNLRQWIERCREFKHVAFAYSFPKDNRELKGASGRIFPGVALLAQEVKTN